MSFDESERFREVLSHFPTGVVVVTAGGEQGPAGLAIGSFASVSLTPRMVAFFVDKASTSWPPIQKAGVFAINILADDQADVCRAFARSGGDKFAGFEWRAAAGGAPILDGVVAWIVCEIERELKMGDHLMVLGRVIDLAAERDQPPLVFHRGEFPGLRLP